MQEFEELIMNADFTLTRASTIKAQLPVLIAPVKVEKVIVKDEAIVAEN